MRAASWSLVWAAAVALAGCLGPELPEQGGTDASTDVGVDAKDPCVGDACGGQLLPCQSDAECAPAGVCHPAIGVCVGCVDDGDCGDAQCHPKTLVCVQCLDDGDCKGGFCHPDKSQCVPCLDAKDCPGGNCQTGVGCVGCGADAECDDGNPCTKDACDAASGQCQSAPTADGAPCGDPNDPCTAKDVCVAGACQHHRSAGCGCPDGSAPKPDGTCGGCVADSDCFTGDACWVGVCDAATGQCVKKPRPEGTLCDDGDPCTTSAVCSNGACVPTAWEPTCVCKPPACKLPLVAVDTNGDGCGDLCACPNGQLPGADGTCGGPVCQTDSDCGVSGYCTKAVCVAGVCVAKPAAEGTPCNDGDPCTLGDVCQQGQCLATKKDPACVCKPVVCKLPLVAHDTDGDGCADLCACPNGQKPGADGTCGQVTCFDGKSCDDGNPCTFDKCDPATGTCHSAPVADGAPCEDGDLCTVGDVCQKGQCVATQTDPFCACDPVACKLPLVAHDTNGDGCADLCACPNGHKPGPDGTCGGWACGVGSDCDDGNPCTAEECDAATGSCVYKALPDGTVCEDGNPCTKSSACHQGACQPTFWEPNCVCKPIACQPPLVGHDTNGDGCVDHCACPDGSSPGADGTCGGASCFDGADCDDGNPCTLEDCDASKGICVVKTLPDGWACEDGDPCTVGDTCKAGACQPAMKDPDCACAPFVCGPNMLPVDVDGDGCTDGCTQSCKKMCDPAACAPNEVQVDTDGDGCYDACKACPAGQHGEDWNGDGCVDVCACEDASDPAGACCPAFACLIGTPYDSDGDGCPDACPTACKDNSGCGKAQYCARDTGGCGQVGVCEVRPLGCPDVWKPVCGCDGQTYGNACDAAAFGVSVAYEGVCKKP